HLSHTRRSSELGREASPLWARRHAGRGSVVVPPRAGWRRPLAGVTPAPQVPGMPRGLSFVGPASCRPAECRGASMGRLAPAFGRDKPGPTGSAQVQRPLLCGAGLMPAGGASWSLYGPACVALLLG